MREGEKEERRRKRESEKVMKRKNPVLPGSQVLLKQLPPALAKPTGSVVQPDPPSASQSSPSPTPLTPCAPITFTPGILTPGGCFRSWPQRGLPSEGPSPTHRGIAAESLTPTLRLLLQLGDPPTGGAGTSTGLQSDPAFCLHSSEATLLTLPWRPEALRSKTSVRTCRTWFLIRCL